MRKNERERERERERGRGRVRKRVKRERECAYDIVAFEKKTLYREREVGKRIRMFFLTDKKCKTYHRLTILI